MSGAATVPSTGRLEQEKDARRQRFSLGAPTPPKLKVTPTPSSQ